MLPRKLPPTYYWRLVAVFLVSFPSSSLAHVRMTFPPARKYDLDALSSAFTPGPCGMPRGEETSVYIYSPTFTGFPDYLKLKYVYSPTADESYVTDIEAGRTFNVTWNLGASHEVSSSIFDA